MIIRLLCMVKLLNLTKQRARTELEFIQWTAACTEPLFEATCYLKRFRQVTKVSAPANTQLTVGR